MSDSAVKKSDDKASEGDKKGLKLQSGQVLVGIVFVIAELWLLLVIVKETFDLRIDHSGNSDNTGKVASPWSTLSMVYPVAGSLMYLVSVLVGVQLMKDREPFKVEGLMVVYNLYQTVFNVVSVIGFIYVVVKDKIPLAGKFFEPEKDDMFWLGFLLYAHYQNKYLELLDTFFMVVRKKNDQISFLHVEHHTIMVGVWYTVLHYQPGGDPWFGAFANSVIHSMMYAYYLMALLQMKCPWKQYVTQAQLIQFVACLTQALYVIYLGSTPTWLACVQIAVMLNMLILFSNFYNKRYIKGKDTSKTE